jgi:ribonuclease P protein component
VLPKQYRLPKEKFQYIYKNGKKLRGKYGMLVFVESKDLNNPQLGIVVSKKIGNAVMRHKMTRLIRNIFFNTVNNDEKLKVSPTLLQYVAFEYCEDYHLLEKELVSQLEKALK